MNKITKRWKNFIIMEMHMHDMVEIDKKYYVCVPSFISDRDIINNFKTGVYVAKYTLKELENVKGSHPNFRMMYDIVVVWNSPCQCGSDMLCLPHSDWCPKYNT
jgi:hypothetical protein